MGENEVKGKWLFGEECWVVFTREKERNKYLFYLFVSPIYYFC